MWLAETVAPAGIMESQDKAMQDEARQENRTIIRPEE